MFFHRLGQMEDIRPFVFWKFDFALFAVFGRVKNCQRIGTCVGADYRA